MHLLRICLCLVEQRQFFVVISLNAVNIYENLIEADITKKTKVVVQVHYADVSCEMDTIIEIAKEHNLYV